MPRKSRINAAGASHHVFARGIDRGKIFQDPTEKRHFIERLEEIIKDTEMRCVAWATIPNDFHLYEPDSCGISPPWSNILLADMG